MQGNPANRNIIFEHGIVDYMNHILRSGKYHDVATEEQVSLKNCSFLILLKNSTVFDCLFVNILGFRFGREYQKSTDDHD